MKFTKYALIDKNGDYLHIEQDEYGLTIFSFSNADSATLFDNNNDAMKVGKELLAGGTINNIDSFIEEMPSAVVPITKEIRVGTPEII